jgi:hypothetical protein
VLKEVASYILTYNLYSALLYSTFYSQQLAINLFSPQPLLAS